MSVLAGSLAHSRRKCLTYMQLGNESTGHYNEATDHIMLASVPKETSLIVW